MTNALVTTAELCSELRVSRTTIHRARKKGLIQPAVKLNRAVRWNPMQVLLALSPANSTSNKAAEAAATH